MRSGDQPDHPAATARLEAERAAMEKAEAEAKLAEAEARVHVYKLHARLVGSIVMGVYVLFQMGNAEDFAERLTWVVVLFVLLGVVAAERALDFVAGRRS